MLELDFSPLTETEILNAPVIPDQVEVSPIIPVPADAPEMDFRHPEFGRPSASSKYTTVDGRLAGYMLRYDTPAGLKTFCPVTYCRAGDTLAWRAKGFPSPYPIYNVRELILRPAEPVLVVHGEKAADAGKILFPQFVVVTNPFGFGLAHNADWSPLAGREVVICPDHSKHTDEIIERISAAIFGASPDSIRVLPPKHFASSTWKDGSRVRRPAVPAGWDLHDALVEGWTAELIARELGDFRRLPWIERPIGLELPGKLNFYVGEEGIIAERVGKTSTYREWISSQIDPDAQVRDVDGLNWGQKFRFKTPDGQSKNIVLPASLLAGDAVSLREELLGAGLRIGVTSFARESLTEYFSRCQSPKRILNADRIGWHGGAFVTTKRTLGIHSSGEPIEFFGSDRSKVGQTAGTLESWQELIATSAAKSHAMVFAVSCALAAPLIHVVNAESGGFHFFGRSSVGKTTALQVAGSVWGGGDVEGYIKTWRATSNGLEGIAAAHCDVLLCLDEISQVRGNDAGQCAYMLANGTGKIRANKFGAARPPMTWRVMILSSGEMTLDAKVREEKGFSHAAAGQLVRFVDLPAEEGKGLGMFHSLGGHESAEALSRSLKDSCALNYGHAGLAFVDFIASDLIQVAGSTKRLMAEFLASLRLSASADGQVLRVARRFALVAAAGEMAIGTGILPWAEGSANESGRVMFDRWVESRGGVEAGEEARALEQVRYFLNKNAASLDFAINDESLANSPGFTKTLPNEGKCFCFPAEVWKRDVCQGLDPHLAARILLSKGYLIADSGRVDKQVRFGIQRKRFYVVKETILAEVEPDSRATGKLSFDS